jgi:hypothetical protein
MVWAGICHDGRTQFKIVHGTSTRAQVHHPVPVVFPVDFDGGEHVYRVHPINVQLVTDPVIMPAKKNTDVTHVT